MYRRFVWQIVLIPIGVIAIVPVIGSSRLLQQSVGDSRETVDPSTRGQTTSTDGSGSSRAKFKFSVTIRRPTGPPRVDLGIKDASGNSVTAACATCHSARPPDYGNRRPEDLTEFHQGLVFTHGQVTCLSCHNSNDYDSLKLADGASVAFIDVMILCAQCHGPQSKEYLHGAHGGMNGYWDLTRGPRTRNNCIDCHDPHAPAFPAMKPTFKPRDRFLSGTNQLKGHDHE